MYPPPERIPFSAILFVTAGIFFVVWRLILWIRDAEMNLIVPDLFKDEQRG